MVETLRDLFAERRLTQAEVERRAGYPKRYLTRLFGGEVRLQVAHVYDMLEAAGIEPQMLYLRLAGQGSMADIERRLEALERAARQQPGGQGNGS